MEIIKLTYPQINENQSYDSSVMSIGTFDGVHLGHQLVIQTALNIADNQLLKSAVMTFYPHPREVIGKAKDIVTITSLQERLTIFKNMGIDVVYLVSFNKAIAQISPEMFIKHFIISLQVKHVVVGFDFRFGKGGIGTPDLLKEMSKDLYKLSTIQPVKMGEKKVSSTEIRKNLAIGNIEKVKRLLGTPYRTKGTIRSLEGEDLFKTKKLEIGLDNYGSLFSSNLKSND